MSSTLPPTGDDTSAVAPAPDSRLDALLQQMLGRGGLAPSIKSAQLAQLGLDGVSHSRTRQEVASPSAGVGGGAAGAAAARAGRRGGSSGGGVNSIGSDDLAPSFHREVVWEDAPRRRLPRFAGFAAVVSAVLVVVLLFTLLPDGDNAAVTDATVTPNLAASPDASPAALGTVGADASASVDPASVLEPDEAGRVYVIGQRAAQTGVRGEVLALDAASGATLYTLDVGTRVDAAVSSDGRILYIAWTPTDGGDDQLAAYDALNGVQRWRVNVPGRVWLDTQPGAQPASTLLANASGQVSVMRCGACDAEGVGRRTQRVHNAADGVMLGELPLGGCDGAVFQQLMVGSAIVICADQPAQRITLQDGERPLFDSGPLADAPPDTFVAGPDDGTLYLLSGTEVYRVSGPIGLVVAQFAVTPDLLASSAQPFIMPGSTGLRLFIGPFPSGASGTDDPGAQVALISTRTFTEDLRFTPNPPLTSAVVAPGRDGRSLLGVSTTLHDGGVIPQEAIVRYGLDGRSRTLLTLTGFTTQRLVSAAQPLEPAAPSQATLFALATNADGQDRLIGWDLGSGGQVLDLALQPTSDAIVSPDGTRLFVGSGGALLSIDLATGREDWRVAWAHRTAVPADQGPTALAASSDGFRLYVRSSAPRGPDTGDHFVQMFDARSGESLGEIPNAGGCAGRMHVAGVWLWIVCHGNTPTEVINTETGERRTVDAISGTIIASEKVPSADILAVLMLVDGTYEVRTFAMQRQHDLALEGGTVALVGSDALTLLELFGLSSDGRTMAFGVGLDSGADGPEASQLFLQSRLPWENVGVLTPSLPINVRDLVFVPNSTDVVYAGWDGSQTHLERAAQDGTTSSVALTSLRLTRIVGVSVNRHYSGNPSKYSCIETAHTYIDIAQPDGRRVIFGYPGTGMHLGIGPEAGWFDGGTLVTWELDVPGEVQVELWPLSHEPGTYATSVTPIDVSADGRQQRMVLDLEARCWEIRATAGDATFRAVVRVHPAPDIAVNAWDLLAAEQRRADLTPYPVPDTCEVSDLGVYLRSANGTEAWQFGWVRLPDGVLFAGANPVVLADLVAKGNAESPPAFSIVATHESGVQQMLDVEELRSDGSQHFDWRVYRTWLATLTFDQPGCWTLDVDTGEITDISIVYVYPEPVAAVLDLRRSERAALLTDAPASCAATAWVGPVWRVQATDAGVYWLDGAGLTLGTRLGTLVVGENTVDWLRAYAPDDGVLRADTPITLSGTRLDPRVGVEDSFTLNTVVANGWTDQGVASSAHVETGRSIVSIPEPGCWAVSAQIGAQLVDAVLWVPPA